jgi:hypothetical protein
VTEQRRYPRITVSFFIDWGFTAECGQQGRVTSISLGGCFVQTPIEPLQTGEHVFLRLCLPEERLLKSEVRYHLESVGFGVMFYDLTIEDQLALEALITSYQK